MTCSKNRSRMRRRGRVATVLAISGLALSATGFACRDQGPGPDSVRTRWLVAQAGNGTPRPVIVGNTIFFATGDGQVVARDVATGTPRWTASVGPTPATAATLVASAGAVVVSVLFETIGLDAATGRRL